MSEETYTTNGGPSRSGTWPEESSPPQNMQRNKVVAKQNRPTESPQKEPIALLAKELCTSLVLANPQQADGDLSLPNNQNCNWQATKTTVSIINQDINT